MRMPSMPAPTEDDERRRLSAEDAALGMPYGVRLEETEETELDAAREAVGVGVGRPMLSGAFVGVCDELLVRKSSHEVGSLLLGTKETKTASVSTNVTEYPNDHSVVDF